VWVPDKDKCPDDMTVPERNALFAESIAVDPADRRSRRFVARRTADGRLELFDIKWSRDEAGDPEFHGHPASRIDRNVLKQMRDQGLLTLAEFNRLRKELPGC